MATPWDFLAQRAAAEQNLIRPTAIQQPAARAPLTYYGQQIPRDWWMNTYKGGLDQQRAWLPTVIRGANQPATAAFSSGNPPPGWPYYPNDPGRGASAAAAAGLPDWLIRMYPQLAGMDASQLDEFLNYSTLLGMPPGWDRMGGGGTDNSLGYAQLAWDKEQFGKTWPEQVRQWQEQFNLSQQGQNWNQGFQQAEADRAYQQFLQQQALAQSQFNESLRSNRWNEGFQEQRARVGDEQWGKEFTAAEGDRQYSRNLNDRQFASNESQQAWQRAQDQWNQAMQQAAWGEQVKQNAEQNKLTREGQAMAAFGRRFAPSATAM